MASRDSQLQISTKTIWTIALPLVISGFNETIIEASDTAFLARVGVSQYKMPTLELNGTQVVTSALVHTRFNGWGSWVQ